MPATLERPRKLTVNHELAATFSAGGMAVPGAVESSQEIKGSSSEFCTDTDYCSQTGCGGCTVTCMTCTTCPGSFGSVCCPEDPY